MGREDPRPGRAAAASWPVEGTVGYEFLNVVLSTTAEAEPNALEVDALEDIVVGGRSLVLLRRR